MTPAQSFTVAALAAIVPALSGAIAWIVGRGARRVAAKIQEHDQWMRDAAQNAEESKKRAAAAEAKADRIEKKCDKCNAKLDRVLGVVYELMEDIEEQIIPAAMLPQTDPRGIRNALRAAVQRAREKLAVS